MARPWTRLASSLWPPAAGRGHRHCAPRSALATVPHQRERERLELRERLRYLLPKAAECGLTIMTGTDVVGSIPREVALLAELGLSPHAALAAASTSARQF